MSNAYEVLRQRLVDIICNGRGDQIAGGNLGADALNKHIPLLRFRESHNRAPLTDSTYPTPMFDRAVFINWVSDEDDPELNNPLDSAQFMLAKIEVQHGVLYGADSSAFTMAVSPENQNTNVVTSRERGLNDALRIRRALACPDLLRGGTAIDPVPMACVREGSTTLADLGGGRLLVSTLYSLRYQLNNSVSYDPTA